MTGSTGATYWRPDPRQLGVLAAEFVQWTRVSFADHLVEDREALWLLRMESQSRNRLGYLLGRGLANVAEVRPLTFGDREALTALANEGLNADWYRVRAAQSYSTRELPRQSLDEATAA